MKVEYAGPKTWLEVDIRGWRNGGRLAGGEGGGHSFKLPLLGEATFGFSDEVSSGGKPVCKIKASFPVATDPATGSVTVRLGSEGVFGVPPPKGRQLLTHSQRLPVLIPDGKKTLIWTGFVDESPGSETSSPEERATKAGLAWIFKICAGDKEK